MATMPLSGPNALFIAPRITIASAKCSTDCGTLHIAHSYSAALSLTDRAHTIQWPTSTAETARSRITSRTPRLDWTPLGPSEGAATPTPCELRIANRVPNTGASAAGSHPGLPSPNGSMPSTWNSTSSGYAETERFCTEEYADGKEEGELSDAAGNAALAGRRGNHS